MASTRCNWESMTCLTWAERIWKEVVRKTCNKRIGNNSQHCHIVPIVMANRGRNPYAHTKESPKWLREFPDAAF